MKLGVKSIKITPNLGIGLAGFGPRKAAGVHDDLYAQAMVIENDDKRIAIICADLIGFDLQVTEELRKTINKRFGFSEDAVLFNASHTHSGPQSLTYMLHFKADPDYMSFLNNSILTCIGDALSDMEEVEAYSGRSSCGININRRRPSEGKIVFGPNENGPVDHDVIALKFCCGNRVKAVLFNFACHASTMNTEYLSADFPGAARKIIEEYYKEGANALFLQGCGANAKVRVIEGDHFRHGEWEEVDEFGKSLAESVITACETNAAKIECIDISTKATYIRLPFSELPTREYLEKVSLEDPTKELWAEKMLDDFVNLPKDVLFMVQRVSLNNKIAILGMSGEICCEFGISAKNMFDDRLLITAGYSNGTVGYIPTASMLNEGGYESECFSSFSFPSQYSKSVESIVKKAISVVMEA